MTRELALDAAKRLQRRLGDKVESVFEDHRGVVARVEAGALLDALSLLKSDSACPFEMLADETAVDWSTWQQETGLEAPKARFSLYYNLYSLKKQTRIYLEANLGEKQVAPSATSLYASANWAEREIFDMFGIRFSGHPDLRRILLADDFEGHPLLKEFPTHGRDPQDYPQE
jgi:NADH/F420H2 dehydrogenase subunit C